MPLFAPSNIAPSFQSANTTGSQAIVYAGASGRSNQWLFAQLGLSGTVTNDAIFGVAMTSGLRISPDTVDASASGLSHLMVEARASVGRRGGRTAIRGEILVNGTCSVLDTYNAVVGVTGIVACTANQNGATGAATNYIGSVFGMNANASARGTATFMNLVCGFEIDATIGTGASAAFKYGMLIVKSTLDAVRATYDDAAIAISDQDGAGTWLNGLQFGRYSGQWAFGADSTLIGAVARVIPAPATPIALYGIDFSAVTFQSGGGFLKSTGFKVDPAGITDVSYLTLTDGVTAPTETSGRAKLYVDTADGDLKVVFGDGTIKTIVMDS